MHNLTWTRNRDPEQVLVSRCQPRSFIVIVLTVLYFSDNHPMFLVLDVIVLIPSIYFHFLRDLS